MTFYDYSLIDRCGNEVSMHNYEGKVVIVVNTATGFRVIIMTQANSQVNTRALELLPKFKIKKMNRWCAV